MASLKVIDSLKQGWAHAISYTVINISLGFLVSLIYPVWFREHLIKQGFEIDFGRVIGAQVCHFRSVPHLFGLSGPSMVRASFLMIGYGSGITYCRFEYVLASAQPTSDIN